MGTLRDVGRRRPMIKNIIGKLPIMFRDIEPMFL
jgi:hypothetical protein